MPSHAVITPEQEEAIPLNDDQKCGHPNQHRGIPMATAQAVAADVMIGIPVRHAATRNGVSKSTVSNYARAVTRVGPVELGRIKSDLVGRYHPLVQRLAEYAEKDMPEISPGQRAIMLGIIGDKLNHIMEFQTGEAESGTYPAPPSAAHARLMQMVARVPESLLSQVEAVAASLVAPESGP